MSEDAESVDHVSPVYRAIALAVVVLPFAGVIAAIAFGRRGLGVEPVQMWMLAISFLATFFGVEIGFHRYFSHSAFEAKPAVRYGLAILGSMSLQGPVIWWAATHRHHHKYSDDPEDAHSPHRHHGQVFGLFRGLLHAHMAWFFDLEPQRPSRWMKYASDLFRDAGLFRIHRRYLFWSLLGLLIPGVIGGLATLSVQGALFGVLWSGLVRIFLVNHLTWSINSVCHVFGSRPFRSRAGDRSTNNIWFALPSLGGSWHNNHHAFARTASNQFVWWQLDICGLFIRLLERLGLVWNVHMPTPEMIAARRLSNEAADPRWT